MNTVLHYGKDGALTGPDKEHAETSMLALHLLQSAPVHVNTLLVQQVLAEPVWAKTLSDEDRRGLTALFWSNVNPYRTFRLDMDARLDLEPVARRAPPPHIRRRRRPIARADTTRDFPLSSTGRPTPSRPRNGLIQYGETVAASQISVARGHQRMLASACRPESCCWSPATKPLTGSARGCRASWPTGSRPGRSGHTRRRRASRCCRSGCPSAARAGSR